MSVHYNPKAIEQRWYKHWEAKNYFHSEPDEREPYTIVIPPPNVTGVLHMGHMLNNTIQDILIRKARQQGKNACWVPGTDHASIATEAKVVAQLRQRGIKKSDLSRQDFLSEAWKWKEKYGGIILDQLKKLGCSCDWERTRFTMEENMSEAVISVFIDLYEKGKLYRGLRMTNWDPEAKTVLSNEEVLYEDENAQLFHLKYRLEENPDSHIVIATQRPETIMADVAIAVHPHDDRFKKLIGKNVLIPLIDRAIPVIADDYVDREFGTGALKITPAHDPNDYEIGQRHKLPVIDILNDDGSLNDSAKILVGEDRFAARKKIKRLLEEEGSLVEIENYTARIGRSERTNSVVEPRLTRQWFVKMKDFAKTALDAVRSDEVSFHPPGMWNNYKAWLKEDNVRDWCISRQLWWGQQIPAWYLKDGDGDVPFVAADEAGALAIAKSKTGREDLTSEDLKRDEDVVDTWFSSWLWPITVFDGFKDQKELSYYYPTNVLVTAWDIMFFWVARMIMAGYEWAPALLGPDHVAAKGSQPFHDVYFTGMVRDNKRRKMSKSLGNSPDALELINKYGADGVRYGILSSTSAGADIIFDAPIDVQTGAVKNESKLCEQGRNFCNKMWNALQLVKGWKVADIPATDVNVLATRWFDNKLKKTTGEVHDNFKNYRLSDAILSLYKLIWDDFCSWYLEWLKPSKDESIDRATYDKTIFFFEKMMSLLHPFMPFITEDIWHQLKERETGDDCIVSPYPSAGEYDEDIIQKVARAKALVTKIREVRNTNQLGMKDAIPLRVEKNKGALALLSERGMTAAISKAARLKSIEWTAADAEGIAFLSGTEKYYLAAESGIDVEEERKKMQKELDHQIGFVRSVEKKLGNERFVNNAPEAVVRRERKKLEDGKARIRILEENLAALN